MPRPTINKCARSTYTCSLMKSPSRQRYMFCEGVLNPHHGIVYCQGFRVSRTFYTNAPAGHVPSSWLTRQLGHTGEPRAINQQACRIISFLACSLISHRFASQHPNSAKSRTGYIIMYHGCPILWVLQLHSVFALSTTEAEYVAPSTALRDVIPVIDLLKEMQEHGYSVDSVPTINCKLFEDNSGTFEQAKMAKYWPRTRHINAAWHHFRSYVANRLIQIHCTFTKQVSKEDFVKFRCLVVSATPK
jgi:hypothetical protein